MSSVATFFIGYILGAATFALGFYIGGKRP